MSAVISGVSPVTFCVNRKTKKIRLDYILFLLVILYFIVLVPFPVLTTLPCLSPCKARLLVEIWPIKEGQGTRWSLRDALEQLCGSIYGPEYYLSRCVVPEDIQITELCCFFKT